MSAPVIVWFRQDRRLADQAAFAAAAAEGAVLAVYVLDDAGPGAWSMGGAERWWLHHSLAALGAGLAERGVPLVLRRGPAAHTVAEIARAAGATRIHALRHYEPWWQAAEAALADRVDIVLHDGTRLADPRVIRTGAGGRYRIFTPFWRALRQQLPPPPPEPAPQAIEGMPHPPPSDTLASWGLLPTKPDWATGFTGWQPGEDGAVATLARFHEQLSGYDTARNLPSEEGSSRLSPYLHHGEISPATVWHALAPAGATAEPFLRELGWRDFTANLIDILPRYADDNGRAAADRLAWRTGVDADADFAAWTKGRTGYPIVDAGMRQLWARGWMHNRVRMIAASFLIKHLLLDWRRGEAWFWDTLVDADYGNNSVNWQWVAGTGVDSNPFGRIMAPLVQSVKFDAAAYIRRWVPELAPLSDEAIHEPDGAVRRRLGYPEPLIGHAEARARALAAGAAMRA